MTLAQDVFRMTIRPIPGYRDYFVSDAGVVFSMKHGRLRRLRLCTDTRGYIYVGLSRRGRIRTLRVHRLVLEAFVGRCPPGMECCHGDHDKTNNRLSNLRWATHWDNMRDSYRDGSLRGRQLHVTRRVALTPEERREIYERAKDGISQRVLALKFNIAQSTVNYIARARKHAGEVACG